MFKLKVSLSKTKLGNKKFKVYFDVRSINDIILNKELAFICLKLLAYCLPAIWCFFYSLSINDKSN